MISSNYNDYILKFNLKGMKTLIGERLLDLRKDANLSQQKLGEKLQLSKNAISSYEKDRNEPSDAIKIQIAKFFNVSIDYLLGITDNPTPYSSDDINHYIRLPFHFPEKLKSELLNYSKFLILNDSENKKINKG